MFTYTTVDGKAVFPAHAGMNLRQPAPAGGVAQCSPPTRG